jgi:hypothetical protein
VAEAGVNSCWAKALSCSTIAITTCGGTLYLSRFTASVAERLYMRGHVLIWVITSSWDFPACTNFTTSARSGENRIGSVSEAAGVVEVTCPHSGAAIIINPANAPTILTGFILI